MYQINVYNSIKELEKEEWDLLTKNNVYMCYELLKTIEETTAAPLLCYYIAVRNSGKLIGASVCYFERENKIRNIDRVLLGRLHKYALFKRMSFLPAVIVNRQRGDGTHFIFSEGLTQAGFIELIGILLNEIEMISKKHSSSICFLNVAEKEKQLIKMLKSRGYFDSLDLPSNNMEVSWNSFDEYKRYLANKYPYMPKSIRHQLNKNRRSGVIIENLKVINGHEERLLELLKMNHYKYYSTEFPLKPNYFQQLLNNFGENLSIYTAFKNGVIIGVSTVVRKGEEAFFSSIGVDHELSQNDMTFFNLGYYKPIQDASETGIKRIYFGRGLYRTKIKRGCFPEEMLIFYKPHNKLLIPVVKFWFGIHKIWMNYKVQQIKKYNKDF